MKHKILAVMALVAGFAAFAAAEEIKINTTEVDGRLVDDIDLPFADDPAVLGEWVSVDFVRKPGDFKPGKRGSQVDLYLKAMKFLPEGKMAWAIEGGAAKLLPWMAWTRGVVMHRGGDHSASRYMIKEIGGAKYLFFEWKSGDYIIRHDKPQYYVLRKK